MEHLDRSAILRLMLPQDRYGDEEIAEIAERCCELWYRVGTVLVERGQPVDDWLVVVDGELEVSDGTRQWAAGPGAIVHPSQGGAEPARAAIRLVATRPTTVLQISTDRPERP